MSRAQVVAIGITILLSALDGYDALAMSFAAPALRAAWRLDNSVLGLVLSSALLGMAGGSLLLSPLADIYGRRPTLLAAILLMAVGALFSALSVDVVGLALARIATGAG